MPRDDIPQLITQAKKSLDAERQECDKKVDDSIKSFREKTLSGMA